MNYLGVKYVWNILICIAINFLRKTFFTYIMYNALVISSDNDHLACSIMFGLVF